MKGEEMSETDTPRTEAVVVLRTNGYGEILPYVDAHISRTLERELSAANARYEGAERDFKAAQKVIDDERRRAERAEAELAKYRADFQKLGFETRHRPRSRGGEGGKMSHFNDLTPAEAERLALLLEEMGEAQQIIGKILRHGYESTHPDGGLTNRSLLSKEMGDVEAALNMMIEANDLNGTDIARFRSDKRHNVRKYLHHQEPPHE